MLAPCALGLAALFAGFVPVQAVRADDHADSPTAAEDLGADIAGVLLPRPQRQQLRRRSPCTTHSFITPSENANAGFFDSTLRFRFAFENTGDAKQDYFIDVTHSQADEPHGSADGERRGRAQGGAAAERARVQRADDDLPRRVRPAGPADVRRRHLGAADVDRSPPTPPPASATSAG